MIYVDEILKEKVALAATALGRDIFFMHGHPLEIVQELKKMGEDAESKAKRYPLFALFRDFPEVKGQRAGVFSEPNLRFIIATRTEPTYNAEKRKEISFKPVLHPIWEAIEKQIQLAKEFQTNGVGLNYTQIDHYFWGRDGLFGKEGNIFNDWIDCVEIDNLRLQTYLKNC